MISYKRGKVLKIREEYEDIQWIDVDIEGKRERGVNYIDLNGKVREGDSIVLNTTAVELSLGTGGEHFVITNISLEKRKLHKQGHIMKLRYTPMQTQTLCIESQESKYHEKIKRFKSLDRIPVITATLHSMVSPLVAYLKYNRPNSKITYIMTDGAALSISFSKNIKELKKMGLIDNTITIGNSFGGDFEAVNIYTGLIAAKEILKSDFIIVSMGPGITGTGTEYGFSGTEQGYISDSIITLGGKSIIVPRISFSDKRIRHQGISHHSRTILTKLTNKKADIVFPILDIEKNKILEKQIKDLNINGKHNLHFKECCDLKEVLENYKLKVKTMGRVYEEDKAFFDTLGSVAKFTLEAF